MREYIHNDADSQIYIDDSATYEVRFSLQGGYTQWAWRKSISFSHVSQFARDSLKVRMWSNPTDSAQFQYQLSTLSYDQWRIAVGPPYWPCDSGKVGGYALTSFSSGQNLGMDFATDGRWPRQRPEHVSYFAIHRYPIIFSTAKSKVLVVTWPLILQQGSETEWGSQTTWILERIETISE